MDWKIMHCTRKQALTHTHSHTYNRIPLSSLRLVRAEARSSITASVFSSHDMAKDFAGRCDDVIEEYRELSSSIDPGYVQVSSTLAIDCGWIFEGYVHEMHKELMELETKLA